MKVILLAGGYGTRLSEYTNTIPKPMVPIGGKPILWHIMKIYANFGHKDFYVALGYKSEVIKEYFLHYKAINSDFQVDLTTGNISPINAGSIDWKVTLVDTGTETMTGGRVKRMKNLVGNEPFMLTYGDGLANVNLDELLSFHKSHGKMVTMTAVHPTARFGELDLIEGVVKSFKEKPQLGQGWINGGYFVVQPEFFDLIDDDSIMLEREPMEKLVEMDQLRAYKHEGFWQCMDTKRDHELLEDLWIKGNAVWNIK
jgi:glucose-1-phosphate cytidylyltransferase